MGRIGLPEIILILLVVIILFGAKKLPEIASSLGKAIKEFRKTSQEIKEDVRDGLDEKRHDTKSS